MRSQPTPSASDADLRRILERDFPQERRATAENLLSGYDFREVLRVRLAILKLAEGDLGRLRRLVGVACEDYRDVLAPAEYPQHSALPPKASDLERESAIDSDWAQYQKWFLRG